MAAGGPAPVGDADLIRSRDQTEIYVRHVAPAGQCTARLLWIHGFAEHGGRYTDTLDWFAGRGVESWMLDLRGHGKSGGKRVYIDRFSDYLDDVEALYHQAGQSDDLPTFWIAHSMGGLVLARFLQERAGCLEGIDGAVILSPFMGTEIELPGWKTAIARLLSSLCPSFALPVGALPDLLSKDPAVGRGYVEDPLIPKRATARWFTETEEAQRLAIKRAAAIQLPALVMHGLDDGLADVEATKKFFAALSSEAKELKLWENLRHELLNEVEKDAVREHISNWIGAATTPP